MQNQPMRRFAVLALPMLLSCSAGTGAEPANAAGATEAGRETGAANPPPDPGGGSTGSPQSGEAATGNEAGIVQSSDAAGGPGDDAGAGGGSIATGGDGGDVVATSVVTQSPPPGDASVIGDGGGAPLTVYIAGDSTVSQYVLDPKNPKSWAGWGQMFAPHYNGKVKVVDAAIGGRTARRFIQEGHLAMILSAIKAGDYLLVQFGTNDSNTTATYVIGNTTYPYYAAADTDFKTYLQQYIDGAHTKGAIPVLVTPPPRNSAYCGGGRSLANYGQSMLALGSAASVAVVDLGMKAYEYLTRICPKPASAAQETFFKVNANGTIDGTHFQENGARMLATFVADGITQDALGLASYRIQ